MKRSRLVLVSARELRSVFQKYSFKGRPIEEVMELEKKAMEEAFAGKKKSSW